MAVIKGINITIQVNGQDLKEYDDLDQENDDEQPGQEDSMPYLTSKYIEATSGARFDILTVVPKSVKKLSEGLDFEILLDGACVEGYVMRMRPSRLEHGVWKRCKNGSTKVNSTGRVTGHLVFSEIKFTADTAVISQKGKQEIDLVKNVGTIVVKVWRKKKFRKISTTRSDFLGHVADVGDLDGKKLKGKSLTHSISLGKEVVGGRLPSYFSSSYVDGEDSPFAVFTFKYCSKRALQSLLLVPRTPSPEPTPTPLPLEERPVEELSLEELRELAKRQQARLAVERRSNVKPEPNIKAEKGVKTERSIKKEHEDKTKPMPGVEGNDEKNSEANLTKEGDKDVDKLLASIESEFNAKVSQLRASIKSGIGSKRNRDEELEDLLATATSKKVKGPIANGEVVDLSD